MTKRVLILGNMGYVGPVLVRHLRNRYPDYVLDGFDTGYFAHCLTGGDGLPERLLDRQMFGDVRKLTADALEGYDAVVALAAISNDPMGDRYADVTMEINNRAIVRAAQLAAKAGVGRFVFASSCSVYGVASGPPRKETDPLNPVTAYAKSKISTEYDLQGVSNEMVVSSLRFATACGMSDRLRLDLVLNDFVACALSQRKITVLSDGTPWRPLIDVADMARAIDWAIHRTADNGGQYVVANVGRDSGNYQVKDIAETVARAVPGTEVHINTDAPADSRSYKVDFSLFSELAPEFLPTKSLDESVSGVVAGLQNIGFQDADFRNSQLIRLKVLERWIGGNRLDSSLTWRLQAA